MGSRPGQQNQSQKQEGSSWQTKEQAGAKGHTGHRDQLGAGPARSDPACWRPCSSERQLP